MNEDKLLEEIKDLKAIQPNGSIMGDGSSTLRS